MVISSIAGYTMGSAGALMNQQEPDAAMRWMQSPQNVSTDSGQPNCLLDFSNGVQHSQSPVQNVEESSCYSSENGADNSSSSPNLETSRRSSLEDNTANHLFPITGSSMLQQQCAEYSNSENESSQASPSSFHDEEGSTTCTKNGPNGSKIKVHKCKSCGYTTTNKHQSWLHIAVHMKPEKILRCPDCPFVTEYKHHLDFHIWNHQGVKPYKCDKCPYHCVNKSMLKSHLKSHSNVYQYRCANCAYRTKYCHSLKIHLRKYRHDPGVVLDPEGNPNPNPVIDVYGNRRGPKQKPKKQESATQMQPLQPIASQLSTFQNFPWVNNLFFPNDSARLQCPISPALLNPSAESAKLEDLALRLNAPIDIPIGVAINNSNNNNNDSSQLNLHLKETQCLDKYNVLPRNRPGERIQECPMDTSIGRDNSKDVLKISPPIASCPQSLGSRLTPSDVEPSVPLNLSLGQANETTTAASVASTTAVKSRRKGIACKLKRSYHSSEEDPEFPKAIKTESFSEDEPKSKPPQIVENEDSSDDSELVSKLKKKKPFFYCGYCEITFFNQVMFTMHMGYHGYLDPFTCNRCGQKTNDNISFYAHMISSAHV